MQTQRILLTLVLAVASSAPVVGDDWQQFRGLRGGVAPDHPALPDAWGPDENVVWRIHIPGRA